MRYRIGLAAILTALLAALLAAAPATAQFRAPVTVNFDDMNPGEGPRHFTCGMTGTGAQPKWVIEEDRIKAKVLAQRSADTVPERSPLCLYDLLRARNVEVSVVFKVLSGTVDPSAGIVVRALDPLTYYVVRADVKRNRVALVRMVGGSENEVRSGSATLALDRWTKLKLRITRERFFILVDDKPVFDVVEDAHNQPGRVGLWTRADSQVQFDDLIVAAGRED
jgi:hypothetical protein